MTPAGGSIKYRNKLMDGCNKYNNIVFVLENLHMIQHIKSEKFNPRSILLNAHFKCNIIKFY